MLSCNIGNYLIKCQSERYIIIVIRNNTFFEVVNIFQITEPVTGDVF